MNIISVSKSVIFTLLSFCVTSASAQGSETSKLKIPNTFETNKVIIASDMNDNFDEIENKVNDLDDSLKNEIIHVSNMNRNFDEIENKVNNLNDTLGSLNDSLEVRSQFVGFSVSMVTGEEGIFKMQKACNNFSSDSHVCNTTEVAQSTYNLNTALPDTGGAWILIDIRSALSQFNLNRENSPKTLSCDGWNTAKEATGATVTAKGMFKTADCNVANYVACCELKSP